MFQALAPTPREGWAWYVDDAVLVTSVNEDLHAGGLRCISPRGLLRPGPHAVDAPSTFRGLRGVTLRWGQWDERNRRLRRSELLLAELRLWGPRLRFTVVAGLRLPGRQQLLVYLLHSCYIIYYSEGAFVKCFFVLSFWEKHKVQETSLCHSCLSSDHMGLDSFHKRTMSSGHTTGGHPHPTPSGKPCCRCGTGLVLPPRVTAPWSLFRINR